MIGCAVYQSPEQLKKEYYDDKIDLWTVGIMTYELLTGKVPFEADINKILAEEAEPVLPELIFPADVSISEISRDFIEKLLHKDPHQRMNIFQALRH